MLAIEHPLTKKFVLLDLKPMDPERSISPDPLMPYTGRRATVLGWWDRMAGKDWWLCQDSPECQMFLHHSTITGIARDDRVVLVRIDGRQLAVHDSELTIKRSEVNAHFVDRIIDGEEKKAEVVPGWKIDTHIGHDGTGYLYCDHRPADIHSDDIGLDYRIIEDEVHTEEATTRTAEAPAGQDEQGAEAEPAGSPVGDAAGQDDGGDPVGRVPRP